MADSTVLTNDNLLMTYFHKRAMAALHATVAFYQIAEKYPLPQGSGTAMVFSGWRVLGAASSVLGEATANTAVALSSRKITATIASYGRGVKFTDLLEKTSILPVEPGALKELEQSAALTLDNVCQLAVFGTAIAKTGALATTTILSAFMSASQSSFCANTGDTGNGRQFGFPIVWGTSVLRLSSVSASAPSLSAKFGPVVVRKAVNRLKALDAKPMANGKYVGVMHPNATATCMGNSDWKAYTVNFAEGVSESFFKYPSLKIHGVEFTESSNCPRFAGAGTGRPHKYNLTPIMGMGALGVSELAGGLEMIMKRPGPSDTSNPFNLFSTLSYKYRGAAAVLNPSCGVIAISAELV
jgi:N4-gp56 family major capsid protein